MLNGLKRKKISPPNPPSSWRRKSAGRLKRSISASKSFSTHFSTPSLTATTYTTEKAKVMSQKKTLEEQNNTLLRGRADWLEPFQKWIISARNAGEIAVKGSPQEKKVLAQKVFGSNLVLDCKKARGSCVKPWSLLVENSSSGGVVRAMGIEPWTKALKGHCSTD